MRYHLDFEVDLFDGQKTGLYLDQPQSHAEVAKFAKGKRVLDCFTNQGGFALACAEGRCRQGHRRGHLRRRPRRPPAAMPSSMVEIEVIEHNVFDFLKHATPDYDLIILDPILLHFFWNKKTLMDMPCAATRRSTCAR
ncbi:MAG: class I SAM-dependent methyltransferase [Luteolibacter sp.]